MYLCRVKRKYDNYDAIEVSKTSKIPMDYEGVIGVPITFLGKYNPNQFEIIDITNSDCVNIDNPCFPKQLKYGRPCLQGKRLYYRLLIRHKK